MKSFINKIPHLIITAGTALLMLAVFVVSLSVDASGIITVTGNTSAGENQTGWLFNRDTSTTAPYTFTLEKASLGIGSLYAGPISTTDASSKFIAEYFPGSLKVVDFHAFSYDYLIGSGGNESDTGKFYVNIYANIDDSTNYFDCRYDYVAKTGSTANFVKVVVAEQDAPTAVTKGNSARIAECPPTLQGMPDGSHIRALAINMGDTEANDSGLDAYFDNVEVALVGDATGFNFEPKPRTKEDCAADGWKRYNFKNQGQCTKTI